MSEAEARFHIFRPDDHSRRSDSPETAYAAARGRLEEKLASEPDDGEVRLELGSLAFFAGDYETAETHLRRAVEIIPQNPRAHLRLGDVLYEDARLADAVEEYRNAASLSEGSVVAKEARLELDLAEKELDLIYRPLEEAERESVGGKPSAAALNRLGCLHLAAGGLDEAAAAFARALEVDLDSLQAALNFGFVQGLAMVEPSRLKRSVTELSTAAERFPREPRLHLHLAELYEASSLYDAAVGRIEKALEVAPGCLEAYDMAARYVMLGGDYEDRLGERIDEIVKAAEAACEVSPEGGNSKKALALAYLGRARFRRDDEADLRSACGLLEEVADEDCDARIRLAECRERTGDLVGAEQLLMSRPEGGTECSEDAARLAFELAGLRLRAGRPGDAVDHFTRAVARAPNEAAHYQSLRYALSAARKLKTAEMLSRAELVHDPRSIGAHLDLGRAYLDALKTDEAVEALAKATELAPDRADVRTAFGKALARAGRAEEAETELRKAIELDPGLADAHKGLGNLLIERPGRMREGLAALEEYRRLRAE